MTEITVFSYFRAVLVCAGFPLAYSYVAPPTAGPRNLRYARSASNTSCTEGPSRTNTTERLSKLRQLMIEKDIHAYVIPGSDAHGVSQHYRQRSTIQRYSSQLVESQLTLAPSSGSSSLKWRPYGIERVGIVRDAAARWRQSWALDPGFGFALNWKATPAPQAAGPRNKGHVTTQIRALEAPFTPTPPGVKVL